MLTAMAFVTATRLLVVRMQLLATMTLMPQIQMILVCTQMVTAKCAMATAV
jgi:hypothetical protein